MMKLVTLPAVDDGYLPYFMLFAALSATMHTLVCYLSQPEKSLVQFSGSYRPEHSPLLAHVYGMKNAYTSLIRFYAAYHISNPQLYDLATYTFAGVLFLYLTEFGIWQTVRWQELMIPLMTAGTGFVWMMQQRDLYVH